MLRVDVVRTNGIFSLDGEDFEVENNVWLVGDDDEVLVIDAAHDAGPIADAVGGRGTWWPSCAPTGTTTTSTRPATWPSAPDAPVALHPDDRMLWDAVLPRPRPDRALADGETCVVGGRRTA